MENLTSGSYENTRLFLKFFNNCRPARIGPMCRQFAFIQEMTHFSSIAKRIYRCFKLRTSLKTCLRSVFTLSARFHFQNNFLPPKLLISKFKVEDQSRKYLIFRKKKWKKTNQRSDIFFLILLVGQSSKLTELISNKLASKFMSY